MELETFIKVWEVEDGAFCLHIDELDKLDRAVTKFVTVGIDELVSFTLINGDDYTVKISRIYGWRISTKEGRLRDLEMHVAQKDEDKKFNAEHGIFED
jgi:hypothetical protein